MNGKVKWFNDRGHGFITGEDQKDYFCHYRNICMPGLKNVFPGQLVSFDVDESEKGLYAINILPGPVPEQSRSFREDIVNK